MTNPPNPPKSDLDYVDRCIRYLDGIRQQIDPNDRLYLVISMAIEIFKVYQKSLPKFSPHLSTRMPPSDKNQ